MTDKYSDLKKAAEVCDRFEEVSSETIEVWDKLGGYREASAAERDFLDLANPATVLALLDDLESLRIQYQDALAGQMLVMCDRDLLKAEAESLRKDAERYRWLRQDETEQYYVSTHSSEEKMDVAIDRALAKEIVQ